jgi:hypothetical protein
MFDDFDFGLSEKAKNKDMAEVLKENPELSSIIPKCEQGLECDNCGNCH